MMRKHLLITMVLALLCSGLILGGRLKQEAVRALIGLLDEEASTSCGGSIVYDTASLSLLTLSAEARNVRLVVEGKPHLTVNRLRARFGLRDIFSKIVHLDSLELIDAHAEGVGEQSGTFRFIDHLTAPIPPEKDRPGRWRVVLEKLSLSNSTFVEPFRSSELHARGVSLQVINNGDDTFRLIPVIDHLAVRYPSPSLERAFELGGLRSEITITSAQTIFKTISLIHHQSTIALSAVSDDEEDNALTGSGSLNIHSESLGISPPLAGTITGTTSVGGNLGSPRFDGDLQTIPPLTISPGGVPLFVFDKTTGGFTVDVNHGEPIVSLKDVAAAGTGTSFENGSFTLFQDTLKGSATLRLDHLTSDVVGAHDVILDLALSGTLDRPILKLALTAPSGQFLSYDLGPITARGDFIDGLLTFTLSKEGAALAGKGAIDLSNFERAELKNLKLTTKALRIRDIRSPSVVDDLLIDSSLSLSGPLSASDLRGKGSFDISYAPLSGKWPMPHLLKGSLNLQKGVLSLAGTDESGHATTKANVILEGSAPSSLTLTLADFTPAIAPAQQVCLATSSTTSYTFSLDNPLLGEGSIAIDGLRIGCPPFEIAASGRTKLPIKRGRAQLDSLTLSGKGSALGFQGWASLAEGYATRVSGSVRLESLLELLPAVDNASGIFSGSVALSGSIGEPVFRGNVAFTKGRVSAVPAGIEAEQIEANAELDGHHLTISSLNGILNQGTFSGRGTVDLTALPSSQLNATISSVRLDPIPNLSAIADGDITITFSPSLVPHLGGTVQLQTASFEKNIDLATIAKLISDTVIGSRSASQTSTTPQEGPITFNLTIEGDNDLFLVTNWAEAELKASLSLTGSSSSPILSGELEALNGWFGFRDTKFSLVSGSITFKPEHGATLIDIIGQATLLSSSGDSNSVILEARGTADNPRVMLSSDRGLTQREIISLLAAGGGRSDLTRQATMSRFGIALSYSDISLLGRDGPILGSNAISRLTQIDSLSIEPAYNNTTGSIDPAVIATKRLTDRISLVGEGLFSGTVSESRARIDYQISEALNLSGLVESNSLRQGTQLGLDLAFTIKSKERVPLTITFLGNGSLRDSELLTFAKIKRNRPVRASQMRSIARRVLTAYQDHGYRAATVSARCTNTVEPCSSVAIAIDEGPLHYVDDITFEGDDLASIIPRELLAKLSDHSPATKRFEEQARLLITRHLRDQDYLASRVESSFSPSPEKLGSVTLLLRIDLGPHHVFSFTGNKKFSSDNLLAAAELLDRTVPFGNNSIVLLTEKIAERYRQAGYRNATVSYEREVGTTTTESASPRQEITYRIHINEGSKIRVREVTFDGANAVAVPELRRHIRKRERTNPDLDILSPTYAIDKDVLAHARTIEDIYRNLGFNGTTVSYEIVSLTPKRASIRYIIQEGTRTLVRIGAINGLPTSVSIPSLSKKPITTLAANETITTLAQSLRDAGYQRASITINSQSADSPLTITVSPGSPVIISRIAVEGNVSVPTETILHNLDIIEGQPWAQATLEEGRRKLLKLGLFSTVLLSESPTQSPLQRELTIKVIERPLSFLKLGGGANSQFGIHFFGEASDRSFFLDGRSLTFRADLFVLPSTSEISQGIASILYLTPSFLHTPFSLVEDLRIQKLSTTTQEFDVERGILSSYLYRSDNTGLGLNFGHSVARESIYNVPSDVQLSRFDSGALLLSTLNASATVDRRDAPLLPTSGWTLGFDGTLASNAIGSDASYASGSVRASTVLPLFSTLSNWSLAANTRWAAAKTLGDTEEIPITQRYYLGGRNSIRGFRENSLGPKGALGNVIGGDILSASSLQLQYRVAERVSLHTFLDVGNVFLSSQSSSLTDQRKGYGVGIRFLSPIGPVGFDLGFPVQPQESEPRMRFHFAVGSNY